MNAKVVKEIDVFCGAIGTESLHQRSNDNGIRLATFALENEMAIRGTLFKHKDIHKASWYLPDGVIRNQIDYMLFQRKFRTSICDIRVRRAAELNSDHLLVVARFKMKLNTRRKRAIRQTKVDVGRINDGEKKREFQEEITRKTIWLQGRRKRHSKPVG